MLLFYFDLFFGHATRPVGFISSACVCAKPLQLCPILSGSMDCSPPGSYVHGILQARILGWVAVPSTRGCSQPRDETQVSCIAGGFFTSRATREVCPRPMYFLARLEPPTPFLSSVSCPPLVQGTLETIRREPPEAPIGVPVLLFT